MADNRELPSDSESEDEDYMPEGVSDVSEESGSGSEEEPDASTEGGGRKRKKSSAKKSKKRKAEEKENNEEETIKKESVEELKKKSDALWAEFMKPVESKKVKEEDSRVSGLTDEKENSEHTEPEASKVKVTQVFDFAGEKVQVEKEVNVKCQRAQSSTRGCGRGRGGIASILGQLGKKGKLSTLEKSKLDWDRFKKDEGIDEDLEMYNKGKNGYLERQDFLQRTDLRQFEIEKNMREAKRSFNR
ncbi:craniofacial development protein 1 [Cimex lectularius]|uniref:Craniofacial development protein 1 n=1 Tax=Cimex lectularius TaxID=79782 RepID=A0A8I6RG09_CIMLE|nr:craniofacial development protein 1 [Cimex lectularius]